MSDFYDELDDEYIEDGDWNEYEHEDEDWLNGVQPGIDFPVTLSRKRWETVRRSY